MMILHVPRCAEAPREGDAVALHFRVARMTRSIAMHLADGDPASNALVLEAHVVSIEFSSCSCCLGPQPKR